MARQQQRLRRLGGLSDPHQYSRTGQGGLEEVGALQGMVQLWRKRKAAERRWDESGPSLSPWEGRWAVLEMSLP